MSETITVPVRPSSAMLNAAPAAYHRWKSRDNGGSIQELGALMWEHMVDAARQEAEAKERRVVVLTPEEHDQIMKQRARAERNRGDED